MLAPEGFVTGGELEGQFDPRDHVTVEGRIELLGREAPQGFIGPATVRGPADVPVNEDGCVTRAITTYNLLLYPVHRLEKGACLSEGDSPLVFEWDIQQGNWRQGYAPHELFIENATA